MSQAFISKHSLVINLTIDNMHLVQIHLATLHTLLGKDKNLTEVQYVTNHGARHGYNIMEIR